MYMYVCMYVYVPMCVRACVCVHERVCVCMCVRVCVCVCMCVHIYTGATQCCEFPRIAAGKTIFSASWSSHEAHLDLW